MTGSPRVKVLRLADFRASFKAVLEIETGIVCKECVSVPAREISLSHEVKVRRGYRVASHKH